MPEESYTIADTHGAAESPPTSRATLVVYSERAEHTRSRVIDLPDGASVTFGRSRSTTVPIDSERVSRVHARVTRSGAQVMVEDLDSRNGTRVGGHKISAPTALLPGDELSIGPVQVVLGMPSRRPRTRRVGTTWDLDERLATETDRGQRYTRRFALIMMRLEGDDDAVDAALSSMVHSLRPMDHIAEYGPDEFAIVLPEIDVSEATLRARELMASIRDWAGVHVRLGVAAFPDHGSQADEVLSHARDALRTARAHAHEDVVLPPERSGVNRVVIADAQMEKLYAMARRVAATSMTVLICGETGVGKEVVAEAIHLASPRASGPFVRVNCACIADSLLESELFGHERGAFTGANQRRMGYFEAAAGGTLLLDEIGEIAPTLQAKLLRVLEQRTITRVGGTEEIAVDVRVVCATNRELHEEVAQGRFRSDLFFRVTGFILMVPPLRDRPGEIPLLAQHFLEHAARQLGLDTPAIGPSAAAVIRAHPWPGNVRELRNAMERALVLQTERVIESEHLPERILDAAQRVTWCESAPESAPESANVRERHEAGKQATAPALVSTNVREQVADVERASIVAALEACAGNQTRAAYQLGLSRRSLIYRMEKYGLKELPASRRQGSPVWP